MNFKRENVKLIVKDKEAILEIHNTPVFSTDNLKTLFHIAEVILDFGKWLDKEKKPKPTRKNWTE